MSNKETNEIGLFEGIVPPKLIKKPVADVPVKPSQQPNEITTDGNAIKPDDSDMEYVYICKKKKVIVYE